MKTTIFSLLMVVVLASCKEKYRLEGDYDPKEIDEIRVVVHPASSGADVKIYQSEFRVSLAGSRTSEIDSIEVIAVDKFGKSVNYFDKTIIPGRRIRLRVSGAKIVEKVENEGYY